MIDFLLDFQRYFKTSPKVATFDPFEKFRVIRGVRHFGQVLKALKNALENEANIIAILMQKSFKK